MIARPAKRFCPGPHLGVVGCLFLVTAAVASDRTVVGLGIDGAGVDIRLEEGAPFLAIKHAVDRLRPDLLVVGTVPRARATQGS